MSNTHDKFVSLDVQIIALSLALFFSTALQTIGIFSFSFSTGLKLS